MQNNFNDTVNELKDFNLNPSEQVWKEIESNLEEKKKRRIVAWWWIFPLIGLFIIPVFILNSNNSDISNKKKNGLNNIESNETNMQSAEKQENKTAEILKNEQSALKSDFSSLQNSSARVQKGLSSTTSVSARMQTALSHTQNGSARMQKRLSHTQSDVARMQTALSHTQNDSARMQMALSHTQNGSASVQTDLASEIIKNETLQNKNIDTLKQIDSSATKENTIAKTIKKSEKTVWSLAIGGGANYVSRNNVFGEAKTQDALNNNLTSSPTATSGGVNSSSNILSLPKTGYHFSLGVNVDLKLSERWMLQSGLKYQYLENKLGLQEDSTTFFPSYYYLSSKEVYTNYSNQIQVPINISYCINPQNKTEFSLKMGADVSWIFKDNWLNKVDNVYRYQSLIEQNQRVLIALETGASVNFNNKFSLSLVARKYLTPAQKSSSKYYWQQLDFQLNIPFKSFKK